MTSRSYASHSSTILASPITVSYLILSSSSFLLIWGFFRLNLRRNYNCSFLLGSVCYENTLESYWCSSVTGLRTFVVSRQKISYAYTASPHFPYQTRLLCLHLSFRSLDFVLDLTVSPSHCHIVPFGLEPLKFILSIQRLYNSLRLGLVAAFWRTEETLAKAPRGRLFGTRWYLRRHRQRTRTIKFTLLRLRSHVWHRLGVECMEVRSRPVEVGTAYRNRKSHPVLFLYIEGQPRSRLPSKAICSYHKYGA